MRDRAWPSGDKGVSTVSWRSTHEVGPGFIDVGTQDEIDEGAKAGAKGLPVESHIGLVRQAVTLLRIAADAGGNHILPSRLSAPVPRDDMVQVEPSMNEYPAAILACVAIPFEEVMASEFHLFHGQAIVLIQEQNFWYANRQINSPNAL